MKIITHTQSFDMAVAVDTLFPLFSPEGEKHWVPGWDYENVMETDELSEDYVFLTKTHDHGTTGAIWIVKHYDPQTHRIQFYKIEPGDKIGVITVQCRALAPQGTRVEVTYKYLALSKSGENFIAEFTERAFDEYIRLWKMLLTEYFASGD